MSLQFVIDGYNITNHPIFIQRINKKIKNKKSALLDLIRSRRLSGSAKNKVAIVFDGYPCSDDGQCLNLEKGDINIVFSKEETADERIKRIIEGFDNPKNLIIVSDDKEIRFFAKSQCANVLSVEEFIASKEKERNARVIEEKTELTFGQMHEINKELKKIWLK